jgi:DMSO/TMAO reductase YedYZ molybdopterin-dependent catalytic subunit
MKKILILTAVLLLLLSACAAPAATGGTNTQGSESTAAPAEEDAMSAATMERYREGELREYNGTKLDPAVGPRDNSIKGIQQVDISTYTLTVDGLANKPMTYTYDEVKKLPSEERLLYLYCVEGWSANILWKGVPMKTLLEASDPKGEVNTIIFHAVDGYTTSLPLQEILDKNLILAYDANGIALPPEMGYPFIFVAEDKWGYKWARWVNRIELSSDENYRGYWESNGYSNSADLGRPSYGGD